MECDNRATHELDGGLYCHQCWNELVRDNFEYLVARRLEKRLPGEDEDEDPQCELLYAAEQEVKAFMRDPLPTIAKLQAFVNEVLASPWTRDHFGTRLLAEPIMVWPGTNDYAEAHTHWSAIEMPENSRSKFILLHEVCHILTDRYCDGVNEGHGPQFATFQLMLVGEFLGADDRQELLRAFKRAGVQHSYRGEEATAA